MTTAIFGGTFNPFHIGHYQMLAAVDRLDFVDKILVIPDNIPPHKTTDFLAQGQDRAQMCRLACADFKKAEVCLVELERSGKSYTYDTVCRFLKESPQTKFFMVCGGDMITTLYTWHEWEKLIHMIGFIAFRRAGSDAGFEEHIADLRARGANIIIMPDQITEVSSTQLRQSLKQRKNDGLIPESIYRYITQKGIYDAT